MKRMHLHHVLLSLVLALGFADSAAADGSVTPISTLPIQISDPGRYCLTQSLTGVAGSNGITIVTTNVEIDLNGFRIRGVPGAGSAIAAAGNASITVKNGSIFGWPGAAVDATGYHVLVQNVNVSSAAYDAQEGIIVGPGSRVERCVVRDMTVLGVVLGAGSIAVDTRVEMDGPAGTGIALGEGAKVRECSVTGGSIGISGSNRASIDCCDVSKFGMTGIFLGDYGLVRGSRVDGTPVPSAACVGTPVGIAVGALSRARECTVVNVPGHGVTLGEGASATELTVAGCTQDGIRATGPRTVIDHCTSTLNGGNGITTGEEGVVRSCTSSANTGYGVLAQGPRGRIQGNTADSNQMGIVVQGIHNLVTGNRAANNAGSDFVLPPSNPSGPALTAGWYLNFALPHANFQTPLF